MMGEMTLTRVLIIPCDMFLRLHSRSTRRIFLVGSGRVIVDGRGDALLQFW